MPEYFETELVGVRPYQHGAWCVLAKKHVDDETWAIVQIVRQGGEATARAWALWWDRGIQERGLEDTEELLDEEIARVTRIASLMETARPELEHDPDECSCNNRPGGPCAECQSIFARRREFKALLERRAAGVE